MRLSNLWPVLPLLLWAGAAVAQPKVTAQDDASVKLALEVGQTRLLHVSERILRVSVADPTVADVRVVTAMQVLLTAKGVGYTHLILWGENDRPLVVAVSCTRNLNQLRSQIHDLFPGEKINVSAAGDLVVVSGEVDDLRVPARVAELAKLHSDRLANLLQVTGDQQVQLEVRFAEVSRSGMRKMGINLLYQADAAGRVGALSAAGSQAGKYIDTSDLKIPGTGAPGGPPLVAMPVAGDAFNLIYSTSLAQFPFSAVLSILAQQGLAKILAEPTLVALSGQEASFHAGGEFPILIYQQLGSVTVEYKKFGVRLRFTPTVLGDRALNLQMFAEVSEPDPSNGVTLSGFQIPGLKIRQSQTTIRLNDGQSFAVAGLLSDSIRSAVRKIPLLGDIPILGALFRSTSFQREESELMVVVTAHLVRPLQPHQVPPLPGEEELDDPDDFQLFMMGRITGWKRKAERQPPAASEAEKGPAAAGGARPTGPLGFASEWEG